VLDFFLKQKSKVGCVFMKFKAKVENESGCTIQILRSDNDKEYTSETFNRFCEEAGIEHQLTTPNTPQQNVVSKRINIFIMEVKQSQDEVFMCQKKYAKEILKKFQMEDCKAMSTPMNQKEKLIKEDGSPKVDEAEFRSLIGCLMYLTQPDLTF